MKRCMRKWLPGAVFWLLGAAFVLVAFANADHSQSTDQSFPTAVTGNELTGAIKSRDIGDARVTSYYFTFNAGQGDLFINIVTKNLNGSVNLFAVDGLRPLGQVLVYADLSSSETGRVIYFRKPEKVILRVEGRTPNDDQADFQIKFAGSFEAAMPTDAPEIPKVSRAALETDSGVKVNSVGTIIAVVPKPKPAPAEVPARTEPEKAVAKTEEEPSAITESKPAETKSTENTDAQTTPAEKATAEESKPEEPRKNVDEKPNDERKNETSAAKIQPAVTKRSAPRSRNVRPREPKKTDETQAAKTDVETANPDTAARETKTEEKETGKTESKKAGAKRNPRVVVTENVPPPKPDPMASISLVILFKDGTRVERPMNEVLRFSVDRGILTVVNKDGTTAKYSIFDVTSVTIQNP
ncbi:MAG TPA: hypothetical protein VGJ02_09925 [Pyrinomonadaceae bacterium]